MIIITGPGRCGTSMMAELCYHWKLNIDIGPRLALLDAGYESAQSMIINQSFVKHYHLKLSLDHVEYHKEKIQAVNFEVIKDPQFVVYSPCIEHWWGWRQDLVILYMTRDYKEIAKSQKRHPEMNTPTYRCFPELIKEKEKEFLNVVDKLGIPLQSVMYPDQVKFSWIFPFFKKQFPRLKENECTIAWNEVVRLQASKLDLKQSDSTHQE